MYDMIYDQIIMNANIISMDQKENRYEWLGINDGKISSLGNGYFDGKAKEILDMKGATVIPGLSDCHVHVLNAGIDLSGVSLDNCTSISEVLCLLKKRCEEDPGDGWVFGTGYIPQLIKEGRYPTKHELDEISNRHKVMIFAATLHACALNSSGCEIAAVPDDMPGVEKKGNVPTGVYQSDESAFIANENVFGSLSDDELWKYIQDCANTAVKKGVTSIHGLFGQFVKGDRDIEVVLKRKEELPVDMTIFYQTWNVEKAEAAGLPRIGGCLTLDGAAFEYTMANYEPYITAPALRGVLYHNDVKVYQFVSKCHEKNLQCTMHAVGERAIDQLLYTYHRVFIEQGRKDLRHRIEHFCLPTEAQIKMAKDLDIILCMQPGFSYLWDNEPSQFAEVLGKERSDRIDPFKKVVDAGIRLIGGSDCPVSPIDPLRDIAHCVNGYNSIRNISVTDALKMYTINPAYATKEENSKGSIEIGKRANLTIIDKDPYELQNNKEIFHIKVLYTIKDGTITYSA